MLNPRFPLHTCTFGLVALLMACVGPEGGGSSDAEASDSAETVDMAEPLPEPAQTDATVVIWARDELGVPIKNVRITLHGEAKPNDRAAAPTYITNRLGRARLEHLEPGELIAELRAPGHTPTTVHLDLRAGAQPVVRARLLRLEGHKHGFHTELGAVIDDGPVHLEIPPYALVDEETGEPVAGFVHASVVPFDPARYNPEDVPGRLRGWSSEGDDVLLTSLLMTEVSLWQGGRPLQLAEGAHAQLAVTLPEHVLVGKDIPPGGPEAIPFWWLDLERGSWIEIPQEVEVAAAGDRKLTWSVALEHFTWFNLDIPKDELTCMNGKLVDEEDQSPLADVKVYVHIDDVPSGWFESGGDGEFCIDVPQGAIIDLYVQNSPTSFEDLVANGDLGICGGDGADCQDLGELGVELLGCVPGHDEPCDYDHPDENLEDGHPCLEGMQVCDEDGVWGECEPGFDYECGNLDLDCDYEEDDPPPDPICEFDLCLEDEPLEGECYTGPSGTWHPGIEGQYCDEGEWVCLGMDTKCEGMTLPKPEACELENVDPDNPIDYNCDGVIQTDPEECQGNGMWMNGIHATGKLHASKIEFDGGGALFVVGTFEGELSYGGETLFESEAARPSVFYEEMFALKLNVSGELIWSRQFTGSFEGASPSIAVDALGDLYIAALRGEGLERDIVIYGLDSSSQDGELIKQQSLGSPGTVHEGVAIIASASDELLVAGTIGGDGPVTLSFLDDEDPAPQGDDLFFVRMNNENDDMLLIVHEIVNAPGDQTVERLDRVGDSIIATGHFDEPFELNGQTITGGDQATAHNVYLSPVNGPPVPDPIVLRANGQATVSPAVDISVGASQDEILVAGSYQGTLEYQGQQVSPGGPFALLFDLAGAVTWSMHTSGFSSFRMRGAALDLTGDLVFIGGGSTSGCEAVNGSGDLYVQKRSQDACDWERWFGSDQWSNGNRPQDLTIDAANRIYIIGDATGTIELGPPIEPVTDDESKQTAFVAGFLP